MKHLVLLIMIAVMGVPTLAAAADPAKPGAVCKEDRKKFCKDSKAKGQKTRDCLLEHKDELSDACKALFDKPKKAKGEGKGKKAKDGAAAPAAPAEGAAPAAGAAPAEGAAPAGPTESAPQAEPEVPGEK